MSIIPHEVYKVPKIWISTPIAFLGTGVLLLEHSIYLGDISFCPTWRGNFDHGAYKSGDKLEAKRDAFEAFLQYQEPDYYQQFAERVTADRGETFDPDIDPIDCMAEWLGTKALKNRGMYAVWL